MTDNQISQIIEHLARIANALERKYPWQSPSHPKPVEINRCMVCGNVHSNLSCPSTEPTCVQS